VGRVPRAGTRSRLPPARPATIRVMVGESGAARAARPGRVRSPQAAITPGTCSPPRTDRVCSSFSVPHTGISRSAVSESRIRKAEIALEQAHVDRVYERLAELRAQAEDMLAKGYQMGHGAQREAVFEQASMLFERDMMVYHASQTLQRLDAEYEGLVFGRLDHASSGDVVYVGRLGIRDAEFNNLVTDWRAPAAAPFYQATAEEPMDVVR